MKNKYNIVFILGTVLSCTNVTEQNFLEEDKMVEVITKVHFMEAHFQDLNSKIRDSVISLKIQQELIKQGINQQDFEKANQYYLNNEEAQSRLNDKIVKRINANYSIK